MDSKKRINLGYLLLMILSGSMLAQGYEESSERVSQNMFQWPDEKKMAISLTFDDARLSQIDKGIPILDNYGVKATFYVSPRLMIQKVEGWKAAIYNGHDIGNHSLLHPCTGNFFWSRNRALEDYSLKRMSNELDSASRYIKEILGVSPNSFGYPCGQTYVGRGLQTRSYVPLISAMFETGRTWMDEGPNDPVYCDLAQLTGMELDGKNFNSILKIIEAARENRSWLILAGHEMDLAGNQTSLLSTIDSLCQYALDPDNGIWIDHVANVGRYVRKQRGIPSHTKMLPYLNPALKVNERIDDLISRMSLEEKIGQLNMPSVYFSELGETIEEKLDGCSKFTEGTFMEGIGPGGGFFTLANHILHEGPNQQAAYFNELQKIAIEQTRLGIPLLQTEEGTHGLMCSGGTIFPEGQALGSTWNMDLIGDIYKTAAREARAVGIHQLYTLVIEPTRDPRLGRNQEGYSEDPYLCSRIAETIVQAVQGNDVSMGDKVVAGLCHYPGQTEPVSGLERGAMEISERRLREVFLPPWKAGVKDAGAFGVMATYPTIDGIPAHASSEILTEVLRDELGFEGLVFSEGSGVNTLVYTGIAEDLSDASAMVINAGLDVSISFNQGYFNEMINNVLKGDVSIETIDRSVRRVLEQKYRLGLFENPFVDPVYAEEVSHTKNSQQLALDAARQGLVLLKNEGDLLPLDKKIASIVIIGPNANDAKNQLGDYTSTVVLQDVTTILEGIRSKVDKNTKVRYVKGCNVIGEEMDEISQAVKAAKNSDVAVVVLGENEWQKANKSGTSGEGYDVATLELTGLQKELVRRVFESGTPTVVVLINGRSLAIPWIDENIPVILEAWIPGEKGGEAVADVLFGDYNPSGKLTVTIPRHAGQLPVYYNHKPSKRYWLQEGWGNSYADLDHRPLYPFGFGLSYSKFEYSDLNISPERSGSKATYSVSAMITNSSDKAGTEIVQLYVRDKISSVVRPVLELKGFERIRLDPGESKQVLFEVGPDQLKMLNRDLHWTVEPGEFSMMIGSSSEDIRLTGSLWID